MKNCEEMTRDVFKRIEEYEIGQKQKRKTITRMATSVCCVCLVALAGIAVWRGGVLTTRPEPFEDPAVSGNHGGDDHKIPDNHGVLQNDPPADTRVDEPPVPPVTEPPAGNETPSGNDQPAGDEPPAVGGSVCIMHNPAYHMSLWELLCSKGVSREEMGKHYKEMWELSKIVEDVGTYWHCPYPLVNVCEEIRHYDLTREEVEDYLNTSYYNIDYTFDIDAMFEDDYEKIRDWAEMSWEESSNKGEGENKRVISGMMLDIMTDYALPYEEFRDLLYVYNENFGIFWDSDGHITEEYERNLQDETLDRNKVELEYFNLKNKWKGKYYPGDCFTLAYLIKTLSVPREDAERIFEERFEEGQRVGHNMPTATWRIDFDKLYDNLDYYADLLGAEGYKYAYQVDAEYIIKP